MPFNTPLDSGQLDALRGTSLISRTYRARTFISTNANEVVFSCRINQATFTPPTTDITYDGGSGTLADVMVGMTVLIAHENDKTKAFFRGRVRKVPTSALLYVNETGAPFADDDYIWVLEDFDAHIKLPRWAGVVFLDSDQPLAGVPPVISNLQAVYADYVDSISGVFELVLAPEVYAGQSGETISAYLWTVPTGGTITSGSTTTKDITITFDPGEYWLHFEATDTDSNTLTRHIKVWAHDADNPPGLLVIDNMGMNCEIPIDVSSGASQGFSSPFDVYAAIGPVLERTLVCVWTRETYNEVAGSQIGNVLLVGRTRSETENPSYDGGQQDASATITIEGPLAMLASIDAPSIMMVDGTIADDVELRIDTLTIWRAVWMLLSRFSTFGECYPVAFPDHTDTFAADILVSQGSDLLASVGDLAMSIDAVIQMAPDGRIELARRGNMLASADRDALDTIANITTQDIVETITFERDYRPTTAKIMADGGSFNGSTVTAYVATAPPGAPDDAPGDGTLSRQILASGQTATDEQAELSARAGNALAAAQPPNTLTLKLWDGWRFVMPAVDQWYTITLDGSQLVRGLAFDSDTRWWIQATELTPDPKTGEQSITATFVSETVGNAGAIVPYEVVDSGLYGNLGDLEEIEELPPIDTALTDFDFTSSDGDWTTIWGHYTPGTGFEGDCTGGVLFVDISKDFGVVETIKKVIITYDATYTGGETNANRVFVRANGASAWVDVSHWTTVTGTGSLEIVNIPGWAVSQVRVLAYAGADCLGAITITDIEIEALSTIWSYTFDGVKLAAWVADTTGPYTIGHYDPGTGWISDYVINLGFDLQALNIYFTFSTTVHLVGMQMNYSVTLPGTALDTPAGALQAGPDLAGRITYVTNNTNSGPDLAISASFSADAGLIYVNCQAAARFPSNGTDPGGQNTITAVTIFGTGPKPPELT